MTQKTEQSLLDRTNKVLPTVRWTLGILITGIFWAAASHYRLNMLDKEILEHDMEIKSNKTSIRALEINEAAVLNTLKTLDKKIDQIDMKLDKK